MKIADYATLLRTLPALYEGVLSKNSQTLFSRGFSVIVAQ
jgi:hypothetical protein